MIYSINGTLKYIEPTFVVVECGGIGFKCYASKTTITSLTSIGTNVELLTYMSIREDAMDLYGFVNANELEAFKLLISISGVGPKAAISILSSLSTDKLALAISCGDTKSIQTAQGIGKKTAERIVLELKDKMAGVAKSDTVSNISVAQTAVSQSNMNEAVEVLVSLGFSQSDSSIAVGSLDANLSVDELIRKALKNLSSNL